MLRELRQDTGEETGFTLVEILVTILIIGVLAAIAIPSFLNQRQKGYDASMKTNIKTAQTAEEAYSTDHDGSYVSETVDPSDTGPLATIEPSLRNNPDLTVTADGKAGYTIVGTSPGQTPVTYTLVDTNGSVTRTCTPAGTGGCSSGGSW